MPLRQLTWVNAVAAALLLLTASFCAAPARADDQDIKKKPEKEKKEKIEPWVEVRTPHFIVASDGGEKTARRFADEFESLLRVFQSTMPKARVANGIPVRVLVARNGQSFANVAPEFPYSKTHDQPAGNIVSGAEKTFIVIRANASGKFAFAEIFQNFAKDVLRRSYRNLPPWLEEGYSTVYSSMIFTDRGFRLERPDPEDLSVLFESPLLPLDLVLHVDRKSGYYTPGDKGSVYWAESRVLLHYLLSDPQFSGGNQLDRYITAVEGGADSLQAAKDAFSDLNVLQTSLETYIKNVSGPGVDIPSAGGNEASGPPRTLSPAEAEARQADYLSLGRRSEDAEDKLNEALMAEPSLAEAEQSLGFLMLKRDDVDEAQKHFEKASQLDPSDALNFYGLGRVGMENARKGTIPASAAAPFEKAVAVNADFAPAWYYLAVIYAQHQETLSKALTDAQRAASLVPGDGSYQLQLASLLSELGHADEARNTAVRLKETATDRAVADKAGDIVAKLSRPSASGSGVGNAAPPKSGSAAGLKIERKTETSPPPPAATTASGAPVPPLFGSSTPSSNTQPAGAPVPPLFSGSTQIYSMVGVITEVNCASAPQIQITLKSQTITMKLHAKNLGNLEIKGAGASAPTKGATCSSLRGRNARVSYLLVSQQAWDGEMQSVEFRSQP